MKGLEWGALAADFHVLAYRDERWNSRILRPERSGNDRTDVRHRNRLRRDVAGVPVILMARVQDVSEIRRLERSDDRATVHHTGDALEPLGDLDVVNRGIDAGERAQHTFRANTRFERRIALRIPRLGLGHSSRHPEHDDGIGGRIRPSLRLQRARLVTDQRRERGARRCAHERSAADERGENCPLFSGQADMFVGHDIVLRKSVGIRASSEQPTTNPPALRRTCALDESNRPGHSVRWSARRQMARDRARIDTADRQPVSRSSDAGREATVFRAWAEPGDPCRVRFRRSETARESSLPGRERKHSPVRPRRGAA